MTESESASASASDDDSSELTLLALEIDIAGEKVRFQVPVPQGPATWEDLLPFMRALVKVGSDISQEYFSSQGKPVSCRAGCGICCRQRVPIAEFEAHRLRRFVDSMPEPRRSEILRRFQDAEQRVRAAGLAIDEHSPPAATAEEMLEQSHRYMQLMIPCPFLENESCSIYEERPLKCREYLVTSPAENCADPRNLPVVGLPLPLNVYLTTLLLDEDPERPGLRWVPLTQLLSWTDTHTPDPPTRTGPELLHHFMTQLVRPRQASESNT